MPETLARSHYLKRINTYRDKPLIKILSGVRRCGKSTLLMQMIEIFKKSGVPAGNIVYINKESLEFNTLQNYEDLNQYVLKKLKSARGKKYILIDEIQEITSWEKAVTSFLANKLGDIYITGSNAHLLSSELATLLTGRYIEIPIYPLGFKEFLQFRKSAKSKSSIADEFNCFLKYGGLPGIHGLSLADDTVYPYLSNLLSSILLKDVVKKHQIRDIAHLERIVAFLSDNIGNISTAKSIADYFKSQKTKITVDTVLDYLHYLEQAFFVYKAKRYDIKGKRHLELHEKYYLCDLGLRHSLLGFQNAAIAGLLENVIYLELLRRGYAVSIGATDTLEIDFVASRQSEKFYIQVSYSLFDTKTLQRELKPFLKVPDHHPKILLSMDMHSPGNLGGATHINILEYLMQE